MANRYRVNQYYGLDMKDRWGVYDRSTGRKIEEYVSIGEAMDRASWLNRQPAEPAPTNAAGVPAAELRALLESLNACATAAEQRREYCREKGDFGMCQYAAGEASVYNGAYSALDALLARHTPEGE